MDDDEDDEDMNPKKIKSTAFAQSTVSTHTNPTKVSNLAQAKSKSNSINDVILSNKFKVLTFEQESDRIAAKMEQ